MTTTTRPTPPAVVLHCAYCGAPAERVTGREVYPSRPDLAHKQCFRCVPCDARVGCHEDTGEPLGRLANAELRSAKMGAHDAFDPLHQSGRMTRRQAYAWLAQAMGIDPEMCHIGMMDVEDCRRVIALSRAKRIA